MTKFIVKIVSCLIYVGAVRSATPAELPKGFIQCKLSEPTFNECIKNGLQKAVPYLAKGIPSLGLLPTDPLRVTSLVIDQGAGAVNLQMKYKDLDILNMRTTTIKELRYNAKNYTFQISLEVKKPVVLEGLYESNGKVLFLPVSGNGTCKITLDNYKSFSTVQMKPVVRNGITYFKIQDLSWKFTTSRLHMRFNNLFNGEKVLGENMNVFLNENWRELLNEMQPAFEEALSSAFVSIAQQFFDRIPLNQIFIE